MADVKAYDQLLIDRSFEQGLDMLVGLRPIHAVELLLTQVVNARSELQAEQVEECKKHFGVVGSISGSSTMGSSVSLSRISSSTWVASRLVEGATFEPYCEY